jgi:hypothetical protein
MRVSKVGVGLCGGSRNVCPSAVMPVALELRARYEVIDLGDTSAAVLNRPFCSLCKMTLI